MRKSATGKPKPSDREHQNKRMVLVLDLYYSLRELYAKFQADVDAVLEQEGIELDGFLASLRERMIANPDYLLISCEGWCFSPEWLYPQREGVTSQTFMPALRSNEKTNTFQSPFVQNTKALRNPRVMKLIIEFSIKYQANQRILERVTDHRLIHRAKEMLLLAIEECTHDLQRIEDECMTIHGNFVKDNQPPRYVKNILSPGYFLHLQSPGYLETILLDKKSNLLEKSARLFRLRLHWLRLWQHELNEKVMQANEAKNVQVHKQNYIRLIKPEDVYDAQHDLEHFVESLYEQAKTADYSEILWKRFHDYELVGYWYAYMLWLCGADWRDLLAIRRTHRITENGKSRCRTWAEIAKLKFKRGEKK